MVETPIQRRVLTRHPVCCRPIDETLINRPSGACTGEDIQMPSVRAPSLLAVYQQVITASRKSEYKLAQSSEVHNLGKCRPMRKRSRWNINSTLKPLFNAHPGMTTEQRYEKNGWLRSQLVGGTLWILSDGNKGIDRPHSPDSDIPCRHIRTPI